MASLRTVYAQKEWLVGPRLGMAVISPPWLGSSALSEDYTGTQTRSAVTAALARHGELASLAEHPGFGAYRANHRFEAVEQRCP